jgi:hypothetical protein
VGEAKKPSRSDKRIKVGKVKAIKLPSTLEAHFKHAPRVEGVSLKWLNPTGIMRAVLSYYSTLTPAEKLKVFDIGVQNYKALAESSKYMSEEVIDDNIL